MSRPRRTRTDTRPASVRRVGVARALSKLGVASRTVAAAWVRAGRVSLNGRPVCDPEQPMVIGRDELRIDGVAVQASEKCYLMLNKPRGLVTTRHDAQGRGTVNSCLPAGQTTWLAPVGRLGEALGLGVRRVLRAAIGPRTRGTLAMGETRARTPAELREFVDRVARSSI